MADLTSEPVAIPTVVAPSTPERDEIRRQVFEATGYSLTDHQLGGVERALAAGARFHDFLGLMVAGFADEKKAEETRRALDAFAARVPEPIQ